MSVPFPEPTEPTASRAELLLRYLDFFRLVQEYARHVGQLDIVTELAGGPVGE